ncbi:Golgi to ER traffic protein 4 homolog [Episyrphus balteatus]|uniref:Golgi to ER traffic protein 4 homolog n=1 Tax=Episyrphus balteatus TaxID=286459 RepID=UPI0024854BB6|nr:Golgi to ER traffic protein 4 homolog [Episyrphus balteatus]
MTERGSRGVNRVLAKLDSSIESGHYYEAHQMYRTLYFRYTAQKKYEECLNLLYEGALKLLDKQQQTSGADLSLLIIDTLEKRGQSEDLYSWINRDDLNSWINRLGILIKNISATTVERETLICRSIKWTGDISKNNLGHPAMHRTIAQTMWAEGNTEQARHHYLLSRDGLNCGLMLVKLSEQKGFDNELDLFICQVVLQQLSVLKDKETALLTFETYTKYHPKIARTEPAFKLPLLNFTYFLLKTIDTGRLAMFKVLCELYKPLLMRDPSFLKYLNKISMYFFGEAPPPSPPQSGMMGGLFGDLFTRLFQGFEEGDDEPTVVAQTNELD